MRTAHSSPAHVGSGISSLVVTILAGMAGQSATAATGDTILTGTVSAPPGIVVPGFLFEPEVPLNSLKTVPIWNELEQLLDNPYNVTLCSALPTTVDALTRGTPGTTQITGSPPPLVFPAYCSRVGANGVQRRPGFGVTLPPLMLHPLNYNATTGEEMRLLNPDYPGGRWVVPGDLLQCGSPEANANATVRPLCLLRGNNPNVWLQSYHSVTVTPGSGRVSEAEIDNNGPIRADVSNLLANTYAAAASSTTAAGLMTATALQDVTLLGGHCVTTTEPFPAPEGAIACGGDPGEPGGTANGVSGSPLLPAFGVNRANGYSRPGVPGVPSSSTPLAGSSTGGPITARLFDATRGGLIQPRSGANGGLRKPSLRIAPWSSDGSPKYLVNTSPDQTVPSNENDYIRDRNVAAALGKSLFWDMQVGSDSVQSCGSCHAHAGADNRVKNQINPNHLGGDGFQTTAPFGFEVQPANGALTISDFPFQKLTNPNVAGDPKCTTPLVAHVNGGILENTPNGVLTGATGTAAAGVTMTVCSAANVINTKNNANGTKVANDVASSMGVHWGVFKDIRLGFGPASSTGGVASALPDLRETAADCGTLLDAAAQSACLTNISDPLPGFAGVSGTGEPGVNNQFRRVEPRNTPTIFPVAVNFDNFWDARANHDFNGGSVFGSSDPQAHVFVDDAGGALTPTRQIIRFVSMASLATGPGLSEFEMSFLGRNWSKIGKKLLQPGATPLANQLVDPNDSLLGIYSNQRTSGRSPLCTDATPIIGKPGLCTSYNNLIAAAFYGPLHANTASHLEGCYTDGRTEIHPNQCAPDSAAVPILTSAGSVDDANTADPFDGYKLTPASGTAAANDTNQFTQMEGNFSLFWGLSIITWANLLMPDNTPYDQFVDANPDAFEAIGEVGEAGLVGPLPLCSGTNAATQRHCVRQIGNFKRDTQALALGLGEFNCNALPASGEGGGTTSIPAAQCYGSRSSASAPDPLLGMDIFQGSNISLKNPNFRAARCGECHAGGTFTDNTTPFTTKTQLGDFIGEFLDAGNEALVEPLGRTRIISGFLAEDELNGNGQDSVERRIANQSIVPCPTDGLGYPGGLDPGSGQGFGVCSGAGQAFFDNGIYNLGVTRCEADQSEVIGVCDDNGRGNTDAFGWPLSHAAKLLKSLGGPAQLPGTPLANFDPDLGGGGGLFEDTSQDQSINPGADPEEVTSQLPDYMGPFMQDLTHGDSMPEMDEVFAGLNTRTDTGMLEGFVDVLGPFNNAGVLNEAMNNGEGAQMGTWPMVNRVSRFGSMKAPQLREVELTGPYFHNGGKLTLRQVVDFYMRGGDFPITNAMHRDFNMVNQNIEVQSNLSEAEKVALVDFLLELTDDRVRFEQAPFDHPQVILPLDGAAPENMGRDLMLAGCTPLALPNILGPGQQTCASGMFLNVPEVGSTGNPGGAIPNFLGIVGRQPGLNGQPVRRLSGTAANNCPTNNPALPFSQYCH
jgi:cytochrome c peroxidase